MNQTLNQTGLLLTGIDQLAGSVQDLCPDAFRDPLRAEARDLLLRELADCRADLVRAADALLDGCLVPDLTEVSARIRLCGRLIPLLRPRKGFAPEDCIRDAAAIEADARYIAGRIRRSEDTYFRAAAAGWFQKAKKTAARLRAGTCIEEARRAAAELGAQAGAIASEFREEL